MRVTMKILAVCLVVLVGSAWGQLEGPSAQYIRQMERLEDLKFQMKYSPSLVRLLEAEAKNRMGDLEIPEASFDCDTTHPGGEPTTVHELRPWDIDVIAALGDSISAGFGVGAENLGEVSINNRGEVFSIGGDGELQGEGRVVTLTNILRKWNPDIKGFSWGTGGPFRENAALNRAVGGATNRNMANQANLLIGMINSNETYDMDNDWKLVTLFVGGNDLCASCRNEAWYGPDAYRDGIMTALDAMHAEMKKTLVQVVAMFDVTPLTELSTGPECDNMQSGFCNCVTEPETRPGMRDTQLAYFDKLKELIDSGRYDTRDDFTVVFQPHMRDLQPPKDENGEYIKDFLSYDCFHPSRPAHVLFAMYLWDAMLTPENDKTYWTDLDVNNAFITCPIEGAPYIYTRLNSPAKGAHNKVHKVHSSHKEE